VSRGLGNQALLQYTADNAILGNWVDLAVATWLSNLKLCQKLPISPKNAHYFVVFDSIAGKFDFKTRFSEGIIMYFLVIGIALLLLKYLEIGPVATWDWLVVVAPFGLAVIWWAWADWSGYTKKKAMEKMDKRKADRLAETRDRLGMGPKRK
jgi:small Trp-rich protein